ncbi:MAG: hypothetical protein FJZ87_09210 [Chloroflexi bacterium]|nr:hypothetical protein [Chloroflexota bacterium]
MTEMILGPIIGGLSHERARLWARADGPSTLFAWLGHSPDGSDASFVGRTELRPENGYAGVVSVEGLDPSRQYVYALTLDPEHKPARKAFRSFRTFPPPGSARNFRFVFGSCFLPFRPEPGLVFKHMNDSQHDLAFSLLLGDQIYADNSKQNGLGRIAASLDEYRAVYRHFWSVPYFRDFLSKTPAFMIMDDHEVDNDWRFHDPALTRPRISPLNRLMRTLKGLPKEQRTLHLARLYAGLQANWEHQVMHGPAPASPRGPLAYEFEYGKAAFFILDTRTHRYIQGNTREVLGAQQWEKLESWLLRVRDTHPVKFIVSSISVLLDMHGDFTNDRWTGFKAERDRLLFFLANNGIEGVHFLAGDLHSAHAISAHLKGPNGKTIPIWEICSSPFEQKPFRFSRLLGHPTASPALHGAKRHFTIGAINYGVVEVDFSGQDYPRVKFNLNFEKGGVWDVKIVQ